MSVYRLAGEAAAKAPAAGAAAAATVDKDRVGNALTNLVRYIPTEVTTLYVAAVSATASLHSVWEKITPPTLYWSFVVLTPVIFLLAFSNRLSVAKKPLPGLAGWPWWRLFASTVAFGVWALAVPNNPIVRGEAGAVVAGLAALLVSTVLSMLQPIVERYGKPRKR
jgi:hypothetical protein